MIADSLDVIAGYRLAPVAAADSLVAFPGVELGRKTEGSVCRGHDHTCSRADLQRVVIANAELLPELSIGYFEADRIYAGAPIIV